MSKRQLHRDGAAKPAHERRNIGQAHPLSRHVLRTGPPEELENSPMILRIDPATIIGNGVNGIGAAAEPFNLYLPLPGCFQELDCVFNEVRKNLLQREAIRNDVRQSADHDLRLFFSDLMGDPRNKPFHERFRVDRLGVQRPAALA